MESNIIPFPTVPRRYPAPKQTQPNPFAVHQLFEADQAAEDFRARNCTLDKLPPAFPKACAQPSRVKRVMHWIAVKWDQFLCPHWRDFDNQCVDCKKTLR